MSRLRMVRVAPLDDRVLGSIHAMRIVFALRWQWRVLRPWSRCVHCGERAWIATGRACAVCLLSPTKPAKAAR